MFLLKKARVIPPDDPFTPGRFRLPSGDSALREAVNRALDGCRADQSVTKASAMVKAMDISANTMATRVQKTFCAEQV